jgi:hypothetical protein
MRMMMMMMMMMIRKRRWLTPSCHCCGQNVVCVLEYVPEQSSLRDISHEDTVRAIQSYQFHNDLDGRYDTTLRRH